MWLICLLPVGQWQPLTWPDLAWPGLALWGPCVVGASCSRTVALAWPGLAFSPWPGLPGLALWGYNMVRGPPADPDSNPGLATT
jgi:hypothetical protein